MAKAKVKTSTLLEAEVDDGVHFCAEVMASHIPNIGLDWEIKGLKTIRK